MGLRLKSLLLGDGCVRHKRHSSSIIAENPVAEAALNNKTVLLYLYKEQSKFLANKLAEFMSYDSEKNIKREHSNDVEVVAVSIDGWDASHRKFMDKGWFVCRADSSKSAKLCDEFFHPPFSAKETVVAFGKDGLVQSMDASRLSLRQEIALAFYKGWV
ncbi:unnamed protein product [Cuscuta campestris]|uniref:Thioredoxin-like fold domain-containing protein n=1 Tax=Cuscuta campestris TaxID=132261 RepID=A0A484NLX8_9ASTE|nr:unnamed protein product [Cuscuta campestris]